MTILFICDEYPPGPNGGIGSSVQTLARCFSQQGHKVIVAGLYSYSYGQSDFETNEGVIIYRKRYGFKLPVNPGNRLYNIRHKLPDSLKSLLNGRRAFNHFVNFINDIIDREKVDIIEIADYNNFCEHIGITVSWPPFRVPLILKSHGSHTYFCHEQGLPTIPRLEQTDRLLFKRAEAICSVSNYTAHLNQQLFGAHESTTLYNGIDFTEMSGTHQREEATVIFTGSITHKKGVFQLVEAWNFVNVNRPDAKLFIYGKGKTDKLRTLIKPQVAETVFFMGHVEKESLLKKLATATLAVFPSYTETFGLGVVEAMSVTCPVIYTQLSCGPEIVTDGVNGLLVNPDNIPSISDSITQLLNAPEKRKKLAEAGYHSAKERFEINTIARTHLEFYKRTITIFKPTHVAAQK